MKLGKHTPAAQVPGSLEQTHPSFVGSSETHSPVAAPDSDPRPESESVPGKKKRKVQLHQQGQGGVVYARKPQHRESEPNHDHLRGPSSV